MYTSVGMLREVFPEGNVREYGSKGKISLPLLTNGQFKALGQFQQEYDAHLEVKRSGKGIVVVLEYPAGEQTTTDPV